MAEHHENRKLQADPEAEERKEERVLERTRIYDEQGVGIAHHQPAAAKGDTAAEDEDDDPDTAKVERRVEATDDDDENN